MGSKPFLVISFAMALQSAAFEWAGDIGWWREIFLSVATLPVAAVLSTGLALGGLISWLGWTAPYRLRRDGAPAE